MLDEGRVSPNDTIAICVRRGCHMGFGYFRWGERVSRCETSALPEPTGDVFDVHRTEFTRRITK